jgi:hypothetical protein
MPRINTAPNVALQAQRTYERRLVDIFRQMGVPITDCRGVPYVADYYYDDDTGELLRSHHVVNIQELAQRLALEEIRHSDE